VGLSPRFVSFEGVDGSGKSTQARLLAASLRADGATVVETREPGGTALGEAIRGIVLSAETTALDLTAEAHLFAAARAQHVAEVIRPARARGDWVLCDRFVDSSLAYQGGGRQMGIDRVWNINRGAVEGCMPDLTLLFDVPVDLAASRRGATLDRIEAEGLDFQRRVADGYLELAAARPERIVVIDGTPTPTAVAATVRAVLEARA
jgi:dTMP kinase